MICYQIFVRSFADSNGDGIGDIKGITSKLDYLSELDIDSIWLTPIYPSPSYHKYDITDYCAIDPEYGTLEDLHELIEKARISSRASRVALSRMRSTASSRIAGR